jgi:hypothetical protein
MASASPQPDCLLIVYQGPGARKRVELNELNGKLRLMMQKFEVMPSCSFDWPNGGASNSSAFQLNLSRFGR